MSALTILPSAYAINALLPELNMNESLHIDMNKQTHSQGMSINGVVNFCLYLFQLYWDMLPILMD